MKQKDELLATAAQRMKVVVAKAVTAFQTTDEYNTILFQLYFKGFELLWRYLIKHGPGTDLEDLDFEVFDKEIEEDEAAQTAASTGAEPKQTKTIMLPLKLDSVSSYRSFLFFFFKFIFYLLSFLDNRCLDAPFVFLRPPFLLNNLVLYNMSI